MARSALYHRLSNGPSPELSHIVVRRAERSHTFVERLAPGLAPYNENRPAPWRFAVYSRIACSLPAHETELVHAAQRTVCQAAVQRFAGSITAEFQDTAVAFTVPLPERLGGGALLAADGFNAVVTANHSRLGNGYTTLARAGYPVLLADLGIVVDAAGWDDPLIRTLAGIPDAR